MRQSFDEAYAGYLSALEKLDQADDIAEKNLLFRQLTTQLTELETTLNSRFMKQSQAAGSAGQ